MQGDRRDIYYPYVDRVLMEPEFVDMADRVVMTAAPSLLAEYTSNPMVCLLYTSSSVMSPTRRLC